jgi:hypothetical protein
MKRLWLLATLISAGCFSPSYNNGGLSCAPAGRCPSGFHCAGDNRCYRNGFDPDLSVVEVLDMAMPDQANVPDPVLPDMTVPVSHQGETCGPGVGVQCDPGLFCVDGYCCNSPCANTCQACNVPGNLGWCTNLSVGQHPVGTRTCNAQAATTCGRDGTCDGMGNCRNWPSGTQCSAGTCDGSTGSFTNPSTCNGAGSCVANGGGNCAPYKCQDTTQCFSMCTDASQCSGANSCVGSSCGKLPDQRACTTGAQCQNGNCVDGYCCDSSCTSGCQACDVAGSLGKCTTVPAGLPHGTRSCTNRGISPCGGTCDGTTAACSYAPSTTACGQTCSSSQLVKSFCDGHGSCAATAQATCPGNFACPPGASGCLTTCGGNADCFPTATFGCNVTTKRCANYCFWDTDTWDDGCICQ